jgi:hypothetical protein
MATLKTPTQLRKRLDAIGFDSRQKATLARMVEDLKLTNPTLITEAGKGVTAGVGTVYGSSVREVGGIIYTNILLDLTGLSASATDLDIIGVAGGPAHIGRFSTEQSGTILVGKMTCFEVPAGGPDDVDLYAANEGTGAYDTLITGLTETALVTSNAAWTAGATKLFSAYPADKQYLYLANGEAAAAGTFSAGKFLIELLGYRA